MSLDNNNCTGISNFWNRILCDHLLASYICELNAWSVESAQTHLIFNGRKILNKNIVQNSKLIWLKKQIRPRGATWARNKHKSTLWSLVLYIKFQGWWKTISDILRITGFQTSYSFLDILLWNICLYTLVIKKPSKLDEISPYADKSGW